MKYSGFCDIPIVWLVTNPMGTHPAAVTLWESLKEQAAKNKEVLDPKLIKVSYGASMSSDRRFVIEVEGIPNPDLVTPKRTL